MLDRMEKNGGQTTSQHATTGSYQAASTVQSDVLSAGLSLLCSTTFCCVSCRRRCGVPAVLRSHTQSA